MRTRSKEPVKLRERLLPSGYISLYIETYLGRGKRRYEYLSLYIVPEKSAEDRARNRETRAIAEQIRSKRILEYNSGHCNMFRKYASKVSFFSFFEAIVNGGEHEVKDSTLKSWKTVLKRLREYEHDKGISLADIDRLWCEGFRKWLAEYRTSCGKPLNQCSRVAYLRKLHAALNLAKEKGIIEHNPMQGLKYSVREESRRMYLCIEELQRLIATPCRNHEARRAFLFSCLSGLRYSDIACLDWSDVYEQGEFVRIIFRQKKTDGQEYLDLTAQAKELMGIRGEGRVFGNIPSPSSINIAIREWTRQAGINKNISFHCGRHTFATMMLDIGTDIYTVSKLLGHTNISTTQIYAKILDKNKQAAVARIPKLI